MKNYIAILILTSIIGCSEDKEPTPATQQDPFIGTWEYTDSYADINLSSGFTVNKTKEGYAFSGISIKYSEIPPSEVLLTYKIETFHQFTSGGFGTIKIFGSNDTKWITLILTYNTIYQKGGSTQYVMSVKDLEINMTNRNPILLKNQTFTRTN